MRADLIVLDIPDDLATLTGDVIIDTSNGYRIDTGALSSKLSEVLLIAPGAVAAQSPMGDLTAGNMTVKKPNSAENAQMLFSGGVKLVYTPN